MNVYVTLQGVQKGLLGHKVVLTVATGRNHT